MIFEINRDCGQTWAVLHTSRATCRQSAHCMCCMVLKWCVCHEMYLVIGMTSETNHYLFLTFSLVWICCLWSWGLSTGHVSQPSKEKRWVLPSVYSLCRQWTGICRRWKLAVIPAVLHNMSVYCKYRQCENYLHVQLLKYCEDCQFASLIWKSYNLLIFCELCCQSTSYQHVRTRQCIALLKSVW